MALRRYRRLLANDAKYAWRVIRRPATVRIHGVVVRTRGDHVAPAVLRLLYLEEYERREMAVVDRYLEPDDVVLEIGAGLGAVGALCARKLGDGSRVYSFEANPALEPAIRRTYGDNGVAPNLTIGFVSEQDGRREFFIEENFHSSSGFRRSREARRIEVPGFSLRGLIERIRPSFLIVDVEGYETQLFKGVDLSLVLKICIELHPHIVGDAACSEVLRHLLNAGFKLVLDAVGDRVLYLERTPGP